MPGGFGTLDEFFEILTLVQTRRISRFPLILMGSSYWKGLLKWIATTLEENRFISPEDDELFTVTDDPDAAVEIILEYQRQLGVTPSVAKVVA